MQELFSVFLKFWQKRLFHTAHGRKIAAPVEPRLGWIDQIDQMEIAWATSIS